jgi:hypothetical protein
MADGLGFQAVFATAAVMAAVGLTLLLGLVHEPRRLTRPTI